MNQHSLVGLIDPPARVKAKSGRADWNGSTYELMWRSETVRGERWEERPGIYEWGMDQHRIRPLGEERLSNPCPNCSQELIARSCKLICPRCHYFLSCSDLEPAMPTKVDEMEKTDEGGDRPGHYSPYLMSTGYRIPFHLWTASALLEYSHSCGP